MNKLLISASLAATLAIPQLALAGPPKKAAGASVLATIAGQHLGKGARDVGVLASAAAGGNEPGGAALVRVSDGTDGGLPVCHLLTLEGPPSSPGKVVGAIQLSVCPVYDKDAAKGARLDRVPVSRRWNAWRLRVDSQRVDQLGKGVESQIFWALAADLNDGQGARLVFERTSTTFKSKEQPQQNQAEVCEAPVIQVGDPPEGLSLQCDTETTLGTRTKKLRTTFAYSWQGDHFAPK